VILETQQYSDSTYRLYDYGRPRVLNVDAALRALKLRTDAGKVTPVHHQGYDELISKPYFVIERHDLAKGETRRVENKTGTVHLVVAFQGTARLQADGAPAVELEPGRAIVVPGFVAEFTLIAKEDFVGVQSMPPGRMPRQQPQ
jgi:mannose-6-phosphate isomerase